MNLEVESNPKPANTEAIDISQSEKTGLPSLIKKIGTAMSIGYGVISLVSCAQPEAYNNNNANASAWNSIQQASGLPSNNASRNAASIYRAASRARTAQNEFNNVDPNLDKANAIRSQERLLRAQERLTRQRIQSITEPVNELRDSIRDVRRFLDAL